VSDICISIFSADSFDEALRSRTDIYVVAVCECSECSAGVRIKSVELKHPVDIVQFRPCPSCRHQSSIDSDVVSKIALEYQLWERI